MTERRVEIRVPALTRVEGEGALRLRIRGATIEALALDIFEPPRYFEKFLEGREAEQVIDAVARICGICPVAYQMSASQAIERAFGVAPDARVLALRRVFYCGEWIQSHALHIHLLAAPDFLGFESAIEMAAEYPEVLRRGLRLQGLGNELLRLFGGRSVHPVGAVPGGFWRAPEAAEVAALRARLEAALPEAEALLAWTAGLPLPDRAQDFVSVALRHPEEYPMYRGRIVSSGGLAIDPEDFEAHFEERHLPHSTALFAYLHGRPYLVGPLARLNLNHDRLPPPVAEALAATGIAFPSRNLFHSIVARAAEILLALHEALRLLAGYSDRAPARVPVTPREGVGCGATEAPRGLLWHRYRFDGAGRVREARIVPPTSQNQARIEEDLRRSLHDFGLDRPDEAIRRHAEMVIRNYDPCISCATHFLRLETERLE